MEMILSTKPHNVKTVAATVDCTELGGRYQVSLSYDDVREIYTIAAPNYWVSMETTSPDNCAYKFSEKGLLSGDAAAIQQIVRDILLPQLNWTYDDSAVDKVEQDYEEYLDKVSKYDHYEGGSRLRVLNKEGQPLTYSAKDGWSVKP